MRQLTGNHTRVNLQKAQQLKSKHQFALAGMGHLVQKSPFQRHLTFSGEICLAFPSRCCLAHAVGRLAKQFDSVAEAHVCPFSLLSGWLRPQEMLKDSVQAVIHSDSCPFLCEALQKEPFPHVTAWWSHCLEVSPWV